MRISIDELTRSEDLERLKPEWRALWASDPAATVFQSPEWLIPWWRHRGIGHLAVLTVRKDGLLTALAPLFVHEGRIRLLGTGESDYLDGLAAPGHDPFHLLQHLESHAALCELDHLRAGSMFLQNAVRAEPHDVTLMLPIPAGVSASMRKKLRYYRRRSAGTRVVEGTFEQFRSLHRARWEAKGGPGMLQDPRVLEFHREVTAEFRARGWLRLLLLVLDDRPLAGYYGFLAGTRAYYYLGGFDPEFEDLSPGTVLLGAAVEDAETRGATTFDFLRGDEPYKYRWGAAEHPLYRRTIA